LSPDCDELLKTLKSARESVKLSQRDVARRLRFHPTVYGKIERGDRVIDVVEFVNVAKAMGIDPIELLARYVRALEDRDLRRLTSYD
jgi:transcriptional regulator with XRE-family HTH domain